MAADDERELPAHLKARLGDEVIRGKARKAVERVMNRTLGPVGTGRLGRAMKLSKLAISGGGRALFERAKAVLPGASDPNAWGTVLAGEMLETFSELRGISMKVGQMLSYLDDALPPEARQVLSVLQRDVAPMPWETVKNILETSYNQSPELIFEDFEQTPIAAASIGQVHRAVLPGGKVVAVKVQYPGMAEAMRSDLKNAKVFGDIKRMLAFSTDTEAIFAELEERFIDECDYRKEAAYQKAYRRRFVGHPVIVVPEVYDELTSERVLVTEFCEGLGYYEWLKSGSSDEERQRVAQAFYRFYLGGFYLDGLFNCDPHPGNYLFREGRIVFLDYGCCRWFEPARIEQWIELCKAVCVDDTSALARLAVELGFVQESTKYDFEAFRELIRHLYAPYLRDESFVFASYHPNETFRKMFTSNPNLFKLNMPADAVFLNRISFGLASLIGEMGGILNVRAYADNYFVGLDPDWLEDPFRGQRFSLE